MRWYILACIGVLLLGALTARVWLATPLQTIVVSTPEVEQLPLPTAAPEPMHVVIDQPEPSVWDKLRPGGGPHRHLWQYNQ